MLAEMLIQRKTKFEEILAENAHLSKTPETQQVKFSAKYRLKRVSTALFPPPIILRRFLRNSSFWPIHSVLHFKKLILAAFHYYKKLGSNIL
jgi:hypothetical protein